MKSSVQIGHEKLPASGISALAPKAVGAGCSYRLGLAFRICGASVAPQVVHRPGAGSARDLQGP